MSKAILSPVLFEWTPFRFPKAAAIFFNKCSNATLVLTGQFKLLLSLFSLINLAS